MEQEIKDYIDNKFKELYKAYESPKTDQLNAALAKAQGEFPHIKTNRVNNFIFNQYADLNAIMHAVRPALKNNGLSITQHTYIEEDKIILVTRLRHESDQYTETRSRIIPSKNDVQTYGSLLKAMKRHDIMSLLNVTIDDDFDDDDGEHDMKTVRAERGKGTGINTRYSAKQESFATISQHQSNELQYMLANYPDIAEQILDTLKVQAIADIPASKYDGVRDQAQKIINAREGHNRS